MPLQHFYRDSDNRRQCDREVLNTLDKWKLISTNSGGLTNLTGWGLCKNV